MDNKVDLFENCRVCLLNDYKLISLFDSKYVPPYNIILNECANVNIEEDDGLPVVICTECVQKMLQAHVFIKQCQENDRKLRLSLSSLDISDEKKEILVNYEIPVLNDIVKEEPECNKDFEMNDYEECKQDDSDGSNSSDILSLSKYRKRKLRRNSHRKNNKFPRKCTDCDLILKCESYMIIHMRTHTNEKPFKCSYCERCYRTKQNLKVHIIRRHTPREERGKVVKNFKCTTCDKMFHRKKDLIIHTRIHTGETPYDCKYCTKSFTQIATLIRHTRIHTGERPYECKLCHKKFPSSSELNIHNRVHSNQKNHTCPTCNISFKSKSSLTAHQALHTNLKEFICDKCGMSFNKKGNLKGHINRMHSEKAGQCHVCNKIFPRLEEHMALHMDLKPFECNICGKSFRMKSRLLSHLSYHRGAEKHSCEVDGCLKKFPKHSMLVFHILKYHKKQTPYICKHCNRGFYRLSDLRRHLKLNHSDVPGIMQDIQNANLAVKDNPTIL